jgi:hypothetical protein
MSYRSRAEAKRFVVEDDRALRALNRTVLERQSGDAERRCPEE